MKPLHDLLLVVPCVWESRNVLEDKNVHSDVIWREGLVCVSSTHDTCFHLACTISIYTHTVSVLLRDMKWIIIVSC